MKKIVAAIAALLLVVECVLFAHAFFMTMSEGDMRLPSISGKLLLGHEAVIFNETDEVGRPFSSTAVCDPSWNKGWTWCSHERYGWTNIWFYVAWLIEPVFFILAWYFCAPLEWKNRLKG